MSIRRNRRPAPTGQNTTTFSVDMSDFNAMLSELGEDIEDAIRPAAQAGAEVLYQAVRRNVQSMTKEKTGNLLGSIYQAFSETNSGPGRATYHVSWRTSGAGVKAPHGGLIEGGWIQRYAVTLGKDGKWYTLIRPEMRGKPKPKRSAPQSVKDAYYVLRPGGPKQHAARPFLRSAQSQFKAAMDAAEERFFAEVLKV